jgi:membrane-bound metal-dependent hydrolase YbcI (DUF457 family)
VKGIAHFISGIAVATFIPGVVRQAADGSLLLALAGLFALLPDTLDFRFTRYLTPFDVEIDPHPDDLDPQAIADRVVSTMLSAFETGQPKTIQLHTLRLGPDLWRRYSLRFSPATNEVVVRVGPIVNTSGAPLPGSTPLENAAGRAAVGLPLPPTYDAEINIDVFSGPAFRFERYSDNIRVIFLPWHRRWTHSLPLAAAIGLGIALILGPIAGLVCGLAFATHVLQDQLGHMGSNLSWPFTHRRSAGLGLLYSGDPLPNFLTVWTAIALILFNLDRFSTTPRLPTLPYLLGAVLLPLFILSTSHWRARRRATHPPPEPLRQAEILAEAEEIEL